MSFPLFRLDNVMTFLLLARTSTGFIGLLKEREIQGKRSAAIDCTEPGVSFWSRGKISCSNDDLWRVEESQAERGRLHGNPWVFLKIF